MSGRVADANPRQRRRWRGVAAFLKTLPGVLTAIATLLAAIAGLLTALAQIGVIQFRSPVVLTPPAAHGAPASTAASGAGPGGVTEQTQTTGEQESALVYLDELTPVQQPGSWYRTGSRTVNGRDYARSVAVNQSARGQTVTTVFNLGRHYAQLRFTLGLSDISDPPVQSKCQVFADDKLIYDSGPMARGRSAEIVRDIGDSFDLTLSCTPVQSVAADGEVVLGDAQLTLKPGQTATMSTP
jgi:hypothetical protein